MPCLRYGGCFVIKSCYASAVPVIAGRRTAGRHLRASPQMTRNTAKRHRERKNQIMNGQKPWRFVRSHGDSPEVMANRQKSWRIVRSHGESSEVMAIRRKSWRIAGKHGDSSEVMAISSEIIGNGQKSLGIETINDAPSFIVKQILPQHLLNLLCAVIAGQRAVHRHCEEERRSNRRYTQGLLPSSQ
jgi:hypothetical protein